MKKTKRGIIGIREPELTPAQAEVIITLVQRRKFLIDSTTAQLQAIEAAFIEQERLIALVNGLPVDGKYDFEQRGDKIFLINRKDPVQAQSAGG